MRWLIFTAHPPLHALATDVPARISITPAHPGELSSTKNAQRDTLSSVLSSTLETEVPVREIYGNYILRNELALENEFGHRVLNLLLDSAL